MPESSDQKAALVKSAFARQAEWTARMRAPFMARLMRALEETLDRKTAVGRRALDWPGDPFDDALALRLAGGLHALVRTGRRPELARLYPPSPMPAAGALERALAAALAEDGAALLPWLDSAPQTNEVGRSGVLMAGLLLAAARTGMPLRLFELGASAGLNLRLDRYAYRLGGLDISPPNAPIRLAPEWDGPDPPDADVRVIERRGVDLSPIDPADPQARERLLAYAWPDQPERLARLEAALAAAAADPAPVDRGDAADWLEANVAPAVGAATIVFHSIAFRYFPAASQARIAGHMERLGQAATCDAPLGWLRYELENSDAGRPPTLRFQLWPGGADRHLADAHPHGAFVRWCGGSGVSNPPSTK